MPNELTSKQCDAFVQDHDVEVRRTCYGIRITSPWYCGNSTKKRHNFVGKTRESVITKYWWEYHKDWTPPVIHDEEWALRYMLRMGLYKKWEDWDDPSNFNVVYGREERWIHIGSSMFNTLEDFIEANCQWKLKYDPDKPEPTVGAESRSVEDTDEGSARKEKAVELLKQARWYLPGKGTIGYDYITEQIDTFLKEADHE